MKIFDSSILALPFFEASHRGLAKDLEGWVEANLCLVADHAGKGVSERGRLYAQVLGAGGWLSHAVTPSAGQSRPDLRSVCLIREALAYMDDLMDFAFAVQGLAAAPIAWFGSDDQKKRHLGAFESGKRIGSLALSEPDCGSDLSGLVLSAEMQPDGYRLNGQKTWVSNGDIADFHSVLARTGEGPGGLGLSFFLVPSTAEGVSTQGIELIAPRAIARVRFDDCFTPREAIIGSPGMGLRYALEILNFFRVSVGSAAIGFARKAFKAATGWSRTRNVPGSKLIETQLTRDKLAQMSLFLDSAALLVARSAWEFDIGGCKDVTAHASMAKLHATEGAWRAIDDTVQLFGAAGLVAGSVPEQLYRQIRSLRIYEGTSEIQKIIISGSVGEDA